MINFTIEKSRYYLILFYACTVTTVRAQSTTIGKIDKKEPNCRTNACKIKYSFLKAEYFLEQDDILKSQEWLDNTKNLISSNTVDTTTFFINSLQSELFYYKGLYQFGINEAENSIRNARKLDDSLFIANGYFFKGINLFEANELELAEENLLKSKTFQPRRAQKTHIRFSIRNEHIYNNIAQLKLRMKQSDSAIWYNSKAYEFAQQSAGKRAISNIEQTYGQIYIDNKKLDSAKYYLNKSIKSAQQANYQDIVLSSYGFLMQCYPNNKQTVDSLYQKSLGLISSKKINLSYQLFFYKNAISAFKDFQQLENLTDAQERLLKINEKISVENNDYIQSIAKQYVKNQNRMLHQELNLIKNQNEKQIFYVLIAVLSLMLLGLFFVLKQRQKLKNKEIKSLKQIQDIAKLEALIDGEENERRRIAQELHDGLNGDLAAIKYRLSTIEDSDLIESDRERLLKSIEMIDNACSQVRAISHNLIPTSIINFGLVETISQHCQKINNCYPIDIEFQFFGNPDVLDKNKETVIYRIIQELLNNIVKHSKATTALVQLNFHQSYLSITVEDNGIGYDLTSRKTGLGLNNIESRVSFLGADLQVASTDEGTSFHITINLNDTKND